MARRFPRAAILGIDLSPTPIDENRTPPNVSFEIDDVNEGLEHYHGLFSLIHMRSVMTGIRDIDKTVADVELCLKPGGLLIMLCADLRLYEEDLVRAAKIPDPEKEGPESEGSWTYKILRGTVNG
jgi:trans-aconitate methyltransferase